MNPLALREGIDVRPVSEGLELRRPGAQSPEVLQPIAAFLWRHADGAKSIAELTRAARAELGADIDEPLVWTALDALSERGLLVDWRVPRGGRPSLERRGLLAAAAVGVAALVAPGRARAEKPEVIDKMGDVDLPPDAALDVSPEWAAQDEEDQADSAAEIADAFADLSDELAAQDLDDALDAEDESVFDALDDADNQAAADANAEELALLEQLDGKDAEAELADWATPGLSFDALVKYAEEHVKQRERERDGLRKLREASYKKDVQSRDAMREATEKRQTKVRVERKRSEAETKHQSQLARAKREANAKRGAEERQKDAFKLAARRREASREAEAHQKKVARLRMRQQRLEEAAQKQEVRQARRQAREEAQKQRQQARAQRRLQERRAKMEASEQDSKQVARRVESRRKEAHMKHSYSEAQCKDKR